MIIINNLLIKQKNEGICLDDEESSKFRCTCTQQFDGERCEDNLCDRYPCFNNGTCSVDLINDQKVPTCDCPENTDGQTCNLLICGSNEKPCYKL